MRSSLTSREIRQKLGHPEFGVRPGLGQDSQGDGPRLTMHGQAVGGYDHGDDTTDAMYRRAAPGHGVNEEDGTVSANSFGSKSELQVGDKSYEIYRLDAVEGSA